MNNKISQQLAMFTFIAGGVLALSASPAYAQADPEEDLPIPSIIEDECSSDYGECFAYATEPDRLGNFKEFGSQCSCRSGIEWSSDMLATQGRSIDASFPLKVCEDALANCQPPLIPAPSEIEVFPKQDIHTLSLECSQEGRTQDQDASCTVSKHKDGLEVHCECGEQGHGFLVPRIEPMSQLELHRRCVQEIAVCNSVSEDPTPDDKDIEDVFDALGCELSAGTATPPWSMALGLLFLGCTLVRKKRAGG